MFKVIQKWYNKNRKIMNKSLLKNLEKIVFVFITFVIFIIMLTMISVKLWPLQFMENVGVSIKRLDSITTKIYRLGNYSSSVEALKGFTDELYRLQPSIRRNRQLNTYLEIELGLTHARLCKLYFDNKETDLSDQEFKKSQKYLKGIYNINTMQDLITFVAANDPNQ
jgi:hypothetical protein